MNSVWEDRALSVNRLDKPKSRCTFEFAECLLAINICAKKGKGIVTWHDSFVSSVKKNSLRSFVAVATISVALYDLPFIFFFFLYYLCNLAGSIFKGIQLLRFLTNLTNLRYPPFYPFGCETLFYRFNKYLPTSTIWKLVQWFLKPNT